MLNIPIVARLFRKSSVLVFQGQGLVVFAERMSKRKKKSWNAMNKEKDCSLQMTKQKWLALFTSSIMLKKIGLE
jgi:hypothetical protein